MYTPKKQVEPKYILAYRGDNEYVRVYAKSSSVFPKEYYDKKDYATFDEIDKFTTLFESEEELFDQLLTEDLLDESDRGKHLMILNNETRATHEILYKGTLYYFKNYNNIYNRIHDIAFADYDMEFIYELARTFANVHETAMNSVLIINLIANPDDKNWTLDNLSKCHDGEKYGTPLYALFNSIVSGVNEERKAERLHLVIELLDKYDKEHGIKRVYNPPKQEYKYTWEPKKVETPKEEPEEEQISMFGSRR